jgi:hypothetical protein
MGDLDKVKAALVARQKGPSALDLANYSAAKALDGMLEKLAEPTVSPQQFKEGIAVLIKAYRGLSKQVEALKGEVQGSLENVSDSLSRKPEAFDPVLEAITSLEGSVKSMTSAISAIRLPEPPKIPEYQQPDFSEIIGAIANTRESLVSMVRENKPVEVEVESAPREWVFDIERSQGGAIRNVKARAV